MSDATQSGANLPPPYPTFPEATRVFAKIGLLSFGGPAGQIALMHKVLVEEKRWISESRFLAALNYCMLLPGPEAQQLAIYIGWLLHGLRGGLMAGILFVLPGFFLILGLSALYALYADASWLNALFFGLKAAVLAVVIEAVMRVGKRALKNRVMLVIAALAFLGLFAFNLPFPLIILMAGLAGYFGAKSRPDLFKAGGHGANREAEALVTLDLVSPKVEAGLPRALKVLATWGVVWAAPVLAVGLLVGWNSVFMPIAAFFSKMAVVTFGGAYAVLAYVAQEAVEGLKWLKPGEMLDGLAMAETTPGPLILVLVYVGFLAAFRDPGMLSPLAAGVIGAGLTTWVTFVPCFLWIFLGAPYIERLQKNAALSGALTAVTAAVVGVILNLALWFGFNTLFARQIAVKSGPFDLSLPVLSSLDIAAAALALVAMIAMFRFKLGMIPVLGLCAIMGFGLKMMGLA